MKATGHLYLALAGFTLAAPSDGSPFDKRVDVCYFEGGGPVGIEQAVCAGSNGAPHTDVLWCPNAGVADRICGSDDVNPIIRDNCKSIVGSGSYCTAGGPINEQYPGNAPCWCVNGNFCCYQNAEVPGGANPVDYYKAEGCNCGAQL